MAWAKWRHTLEESKRLAIKAVDEYNSSTGHYADFIGTMVRAWLYLFQAEFQRDNIDHRHRDRDGNVVKKDGEAKLWEVAQCVKYAYPKDNDPVRANLELFIQLRNKVEHRFEQALKEVAGGRAHALVINYEERLTAVFGAEHSLGGQLRFPIFVESITAAPEKKETVTANRALRAAKSIITKFDSGLDPSVRDDAKFDYRVRLVPVTASKADAAFEFVKLDAVTDEERETLIEAGRWGKVVTKVRNVSVASKGYMLPKRVVEVVDARVPFKFNMGMHTQLWKRLNVRPTDAEAAAGALADDKYCIVDDPTGQYVYTPAWVEKIVREIGTVQKFEAFFGYAPGNKPPNPWAAAKAAS